MSTLSQEAIETLEKHGYDVTKPIITRRGAREVTILSFDPSSTFPIIGEIAPAKVNGQPIIRRFKLDGTAKPMRSSEERIFDIARNTRAEAGGGKKAGGGTALTAEVDGNMAIGEPLQLTCSFTLGFAQDAELAVSNFRVVQEEGAGNARVIRAVVECKAIPRTG